MIYDKEYFDKEKEAPEYICRFILQIANLQYNDSVLDVDCGRGHLIKRLLPRCKKVVGVDISEYACKECRKLYPSTKIINSSIKNLHLKKRSVDVIFAKEVIEHMESGEDLKSLKVLYDLLKPGGRLVITTPNLNTWIWIPSILTLSRPFTLYSDPTHINLFNPRKIRTLLRKTGFSDSNIHFHSRELCGLYDLQPNIYQFLNEWVYPISRNIKVVSVKS